MDLQVVVVSFITALVSSGLITAGVVYVLKKSIDSTLEYRVKKLLEENRVQLQELTRRQGAVYDKQSDILRSILACTYRLRNTTRDLADLLMQDGTAVAAQISETLSDVQLHHTNLRTAMFEDRALLPNSCFEVIHELGHVTMKLLAECQVLKRTRRVKERRELQESAAATFKLMDELHQRLVTIIQIQIGVEA